MEEDLNFLQQSVIKTHPYLKSKDKIIKYEDLIFNLKSSLNQPLSKDEFSLIVSETIAFLKDAHSSIAYWEGNPKTIDIGFIWLNNELFISKGNNKLSIGDKVISLGGVTPDILLKQMEKILSADNRYILKYKFQKLLPNEKYLKYLGLIENNKLKIVVEGPNGTKKSDNITFHRDYNYFDKFNFLDNDFTIKKDINIGILNLNNFLDNEENFKLIDEFYTHIDEQGISKIVIDVRKSPGGSTATLAKLLTYYDIEKFRHIDNYDRYNKKSEMSLFFGKTYILTSSKTYSTASDLAGICKYHKIATIVGTPTGGSIHCTGNSIEFVLPNSGIKYQIATDKFVVPTTDDTEMFDAVYPDVYIAPTRMDLINNTDPIIQWVMDN